MPRPDGNQEIDLSAAQPGTEGSVRSDAFPGGATEALVSIGASQKGLELTPLERQIIALTAAGHSHEESANTIGISERALQLHLKDIFDKLDVACEFELILFALYHRLNLA